MVTNIKRVPFTNIFEEFERQYYKKLLFDGIHSNSKGHQKIFEIVKDYLIKNKMI